MFGRNRKDKLIARAFEERLYEMIATELREGVKKDGLWLKALSRNSGSNSGAQSEYINLRFQSLKDEIELCAEQARAKKYADEEIAQEEQRAREKAAEKNQREQFITEHVDCRAQADPKLMSSLAALIERGYKVETFGSGWKVNEPFGGRKHCQNVDDLRDYVSFVKSNYR